MRQTSVLFCYFQLATLVTSAVLATCAAHAVPVYMKPESRFSTGNQSSSKLETRTRKIRLQRWFRVKTKDKVYGWMAEDHALTALKLVEQAFLTEAVPSRASAEIELMMTRPLIAAKTPVLILELDGAWALVQPLTEAEASQAWVQTEKLTPNLATNIAQRAFVHQKTSLRVDAGNRSRALIDIEEGVYVQVVRESGAWLEVRSGRFQGYVTKADLWTAQDLGKLGVRAAISLAPLRQAPLPYAELLRSLSYSSTLTLVKTVTLKWGLAWTREQGDVWWPIANDSAISTFTSTTIPLPDDVPKDVPKDVPARPERIATAQLFSRKIYDMATSKVAPNLKFVSADGVFRSTDGASWTRIPLFKQQNYPIAVSKSGSIYIGSYVSEDGGDTFAEWIRWDSLVSSLEKQNDISAQNLKIIEIQPDGASEQKVTLRLNLGTNSAATDGSNSTSSLRSSRLVRVATEDKGLNWHTN